MPKDDRTERAAGARRPTRRRPGMSPAGRAALRLLVRLVAERRAQG